MRDDDSFRLIDQDGAVLIICASIGIAAAFFVPDSPRAIQKTKPHCEVTVAQYAAGERWVPKPTLPACAGNLVALPAHILTLPIQEKK